jgi:hypothetical protein
MGGIARSAIKFCRDYDRLARAQRNTIYWPQKAKGRGENQAPQHTALRAFFTQLQVAAHVLTETFF